MHAIFEDELAQHLGVPDDYGMVAIIPIGYPMGNFGPTSRGNLADFVSLDRVGQSWDALA